MNPLGNHPPYKPYFPKRVYEYWLKVGWGSEKQKERYREAIQWYQAQEAKTKRLEELL